MQPGPRRTPRPRVRFASTALMLAGGALLLSACSPGASSTTASSTTASTVSTDVASAGTVSLTVMDYETEGSPRGDAMDAINAAFHSKYPNVTIIRQVTAFTTAQAKAKLSLSARDAPCVFEGGQGFSFDAPLVAAKLIIPMDAYAKAYNWSGQIPDSLLNQFRVATDGKTFGSGPIYGIAPAGEVVGWYYNKDLLAKLGASVPTTFDQFQALLAQAKAAGIQPILLGNAEKFPASHILSSLGSAAIDPATLEKLVYLDKSTSWANSGLSNSYATMADWVSKGYIQAGYDGLGYQDAVNKFDAGQSLLVNGGTWLTGDIYKKLGQKAGFFVAPGAAAGNTAATGAFSPPFHVTTKCATPDVAAAYINYLITPPAQAEFVKRQDIPANLPSATYPAGTVAADTLAAFQAAIKAGTLTPYLDWTTTKTGNIFWSGIQEVLAGKKTVPDALTELDADRNASIPSGS